MADSPRWGAHERAKRANHQHGAKRSVVHRRSKHRHARAHRHGAPVSELLAALTGRFGDRPDAVTVGERARSWSALGKHAEALAGAVAGLDAVVLCATATMET